MNLYLLAISLIFAGSLLGIWAAHWYFRRQLKRMLRQTNKQRMAYQQIRDRHQSVQEELHSIRQAHNRLNSSYNKLYAQLEEKSTQLRQAYQTQYRYLDRIAHQKTAIRTLQNNNQLLRQHQTKGITKVNKAKGPLPKNRFSAKASKQLLNNLVK